MGKRKTTSGEGWTRVRFGDVVRLSKERCTDPLAQGIERYIGLEHLEPGDLRIRSWGDVADGVTFTNRFRRGQVLFGKRRAYQRKVAFAEFDGICSSDIYVFEPADDHLLPDLLPFVCQTDGFFGHALKTSAGSLSPRTNWSSLADYEFDLPPFEEQKRQVLRLSATRALRESYALAAKTGSQLRSALAQLWEMARSDYPALPIGELVEQMQYGVSCRPEPHGAIPLLRMGNLRDGMLDTSDLRYTERSEINGDRDLLNVGDVLFNRTNSIDLVGKAALFDLEGEWAFASYLVRLVPRRSVVIPEYLVAIINSSPVRTRILANATKGVSQANVNTTNLANVKARVPPLEVQQQLVEAMRQVRQEEARLSERGRRIPMKGTILEWSTA